MVNNVTVILVIRDTCNINSTTGSWIKKNYRYVGLETLYILSGMRCSECGYNSHEKCVPHVPKNCTKLRPVLEASVSTSNLTNDDLVQVASVSGGLCRRCLLFHLFSLVRGLPKVNKFQKSKKNWSVSKIFTTFSLILKFKCDVSTRFYDPWSQRS